MPPPRAAKDSSATAAPTASRRDRTAGKQAVESFDEETQTDRMDADEEADDDEIDPSQGTAVQKMILGGLQNVCHDVLTCSRAETLLTVQ